MALIDDLRPFISDEDYERIVNDPGLAGRMQAFNTYEYLANGLVESAVDQSVTPPPAAARASVQDSSITDELQKISARLDQMAAYEKKIQSLEEQVARAPQLVDHAVVTGMNLTAKAIKHQQQYGEELDMNGFDKFLSENRGSYSGLDDAYAKYTQPKAMESEIERRVAEREAKMREAQSGNGLPGVSPAVLTGVAGKLAALGSSGRGERSRSAGDALAEIVARRSS